MSLSFLLVWAIFPRLPSSSAAAEPASAGQASCRQDAAEPCDAPSEEGAGERGETGGGESDAVLPAGYALQGDGRPPLQAEYFFHVTEHFSPRPFQPPCRPAA